MSTLSSLRHQTVLRLFFGCRRQHTEALVAVCKFPGLRDLLGIGAPPSVHSSAAFREVLREDGGKGREAADLRALHRLAESRRSGPNSSENKMLPNARLFLAEAEHLVEGAGNPRKLLPPCSV